MEESIAPADFTSYQQTIPLAQVTGSQPAALTCGRTEKLVADMGPAVTIDSIVSCSVTLQPVNGDASPLTG